MDWDVIWKSVVPATTVLMKPVGLAALPASFVAARASFVATLEGSGFGAANRERTQRHQHTAFWRQRHRWAGWQYHRLPWHLMLLIADIFHNLLEFLGLIFSGSGHDHSGLKHHSKVKDLKIKVSVPLQKDMVREIFRLVSGDSLMASLSQSVRILIWLAKEEV